MTRTRPTAFGKAERSKAPEPGTAGKLGAQKLSPEEQRRRFIEAAREHGAGESEADVDRVLAAVAKRKAL